MKHSQNVTPLACNTACSSSEHDLLASTSEAKEYDCATIENPWLSLAIGK
jgi:hypothetical protein